MPVYTTECSKCGKTAEIVRTIAEMDDLPKCCGKKTHRIICASQVTPDIQAYKSMITGEMIEGRKAHRDHLKRHNCTEVGNDTKALIDRHKWKPFDREKRKAQIADVLNSKW